MRTTTEPAYRRPATRPGVELRLDANEGGRPQAAVMAALRELDPEVLRRYPDSSALERTIAKRIGVEPEQVLVTAGADDAIDRCCRLTLADGGRLLMPRPGFEMFRRYASLAGGTVDEVGWEAGPFPGTAFADAVRADTRAIAVISPNNPTGLVATAEEVRNLATLAPDALILLDLAYAEFADEDLTPLALELENVVVLRSFSKAWGLAGLRVGFAVGPSVRIEALRAAGGPYAVSGPSAAIASRVLDAGAGAMEQHVARVRQERSALTDELKMLGATVLPSQANFVLARVGEAQRSRDFLDALGIAVRTWPEDTWLRNHLRVTCPGDTGDFLRLVRGLRTVLRPEALLFDMDGVLADEGPSYREAILLTAQSFSVAVDRQDILELKARGDANNDWDLTYELVQRAGVRVRYEDVVSRFEAFYQGEPGRSGLWRKENCLVDRALLERLGERYELGVVTGRPRRDALRFLDRFGLTDCFGAVVTLDDAPAKPDPAPVRRALEELRARSAWMIGDTPDDARAARQAGVLALGILPPDAGDAVSSTTLLDAGCARVLDRLDDLEELLP